jgi:polysaccharide chain length determinant protein (PEP-CTERM system associated)
MNEVYQQLISTLLAIWQRRAYVLVTAWMVCTAGWLFVAQIPNKYEATARIYVDTQTMLNTLMRGIAADTDVMQQINMIRQTLISRPNMEKVVRMTDMDLGAKDDADLEKIVNEVKDKIKLSAQGVNLFNLSYENQDPQAAKKVVQSLLTLFVEENIGANRKDLAGTRRFIDEQISKYEQDLDAAERRMAEFQQKNLGFIPGSNSNYFATLQQARADGTVADAALREARLQRDELQRQLTGVPPFITATGGLGPPIGGASSDISQRIAMKQRRLDELLERGYKEDHPDVKIMRETIADLQKQFDKDQKSFQAKVTAGDMTAAQSGGNVVPNPIYEQIRIKIIDQQTQIATLQDRYNQKRGDIVRLEGMAQRVPAVEAELARLNRDYTTIKGNYEKLLQRRESARLAQDLETKSDGVQIRVIDPPDVPRVPSSPKRLLLVSGVLLIGLGAGIVVAFLLSQIHTTYNTTQRLGDALGLPVLGSITVILSEQEKRLQLRNLIAFSVGLAGLFLTYGGVVTIEIIRGTIAS